MLLGPQQPQSLRAPASFFSGSAPPQEPSEAAWHPRSPHTLSPTELPTEDSGWPSGRPTHSSTSSLIPGRREAPGCMLTAFSGTG